jgi:AcrR family transcriptional regulator
LCRTPNLSSHRLRWPTEYAPECRRVLSRSAKPLYREGIRAIGIDTVVERSGVSKTSLYHLFESKDA